MTVASAFSNRDEVARWLPTVPRDALIRAKFALREVDLRLGSNTDVLLSLSRERGVVPRAEFGDPAGRADSLSDYKVVEPGQIVMNRMQAWNGVFGLSGLRGVVSPDYSVFAVLEGWDPRYVVYLLRSDFYTTQFVWRSRGMGTAFLRLHPENLLDTPLVAPSYQDQTRIANFLDTETRRIDGIVSVRVHQLALIRERLEVETATLLQARAAPLVALRRVVDLLPGFSYRSEDFLTEPAQARLLRGINVDVGTLRWDDVVWVNDRVAASTSWFSLVAGDIVMGMDRPVISSGVRVAQVAEADLPARLVQRVARLRARTGLSQEYLYQALRGPGLADHFAPVFTGVSVPHVSPSQILSYEIPLPSEAQQDEVVRELVSMQERARAYEAAARRQIELLAERRQALITAAVTGQLAIPGVAA